MTDSQKAWEDRVDAQTKLLGLYMSYDDLRAFRAGYMMILADYRASLESMIDERIEGAIKSGASVAFKDGYNTALKDIKSQLNTIKPTNG